MSSFTHFDEDGHARMVDVSDKAVSERSATAKASVLMQPETLQLILSGGVKKGDVLQVARLAGIMAAKRTSDLVPLCHPIGLDAVEVDLVCDGGRNAVDISATCRVKSRTGVEMEALTAVSAACLTLFDMLKAVDKTMSIDALRVTAKEGGRSGAWRGE